MSVSRRNFLKGAAAGSAGTALAGGVLIGGARADGSTAQAPPAPRSYSFHGAHQAGVLTRARPPSSRSHVSPPSTASRTARPNWPALCMRRSARPKQVSRCNTLRSQVAGFGDRFFGGARSSFRRVCHRRHSKLLKSSSHYSQQPADG